MNTVVFACVHNAGRSQMAAAWFNLLADTSKARAISAGTHPGSRVHPEVVEAMNEIGVDLAQAKTTLLTEDVARQGQLLITMGCGDQCPIVPGLRRADWPLEDPKGKPLERIRQIRDEIRQRVKALLDREGWSGATAVPRLTSSRGSERVALRRVVRRYASIATTRVLAGSRQN